MNRNREELGLISLIKGIISFLSPPPLPPPHMERRAPSNSAHKFSALLSNGDNNLTFAIFLIFIALLVFFFGSRQVAVRTEHVPSGRQFFLPELGILFPAFYDIVCKKQGLFSNSLSIGCKQMLIILDLGIVVFYRGYFRPVVLCGFLEMRHLLPGMVR